MINSYARPGKVISKGNDFIDLQGFCQQQIEQLTIHDPICFARIIYHDVLKKTHQELINYAYEQAHLSPSVLNFFRKEQWLKEYPPAFTLHHVNIDNLKLLCYFCIFGYRNQKPEYIQLLAREPLTPSLQKYVIQSAVLLSKYLDIYLEYGQQRAEIRLLEHIIQRATHQLRNSLGLIVLYAQNLCFGLQDNPCQEQAKIIREAVQELETNLTELIYCGQKDNLRISLQDLRSLIKETVTELHPMTLEKNIQIILPDTSTILAIDCLQMKQVFVNLLSNAIHFSPEAGKICFCWQVLQNEVIISISDQGAGLSKSDIQNIFTPFYSRRPGGTGLGLSIAQKIILDHQGSIWGDNLPGGGAKFSIILPRRKTN